MCEKEVGNDTESVEIGAGGGGVWDDPQSGGAAVHHSTEPNGSDSRVGE